MTRPVIPAIGLGSPLTLPSQYTVLKAQLAWLVLVVIVTFATWVTLDKASPRKPKVLMVLRSSKVVSLEVVNLSHRMPRSSLRMPIKYSFIVSHWQRINLFQIFDNHVRYPVSAVAASPLPWPTPQCSKIPHRDYSQRALLQQSWVSGQPHQQQSWYNME